VIADKSIPVDGTQIRQKWRIDEFISSFMHWLALLVFTCILTACGAGGRVVNHSFGFDIRKAVPPVEVLEYRYGVSGMTGTRPPEWALKEGKSFRYEGVTGPIPVGDSLYVKWRIKDTAQVFEDNVDLRHRLPSNIKDHSIYFDIKGPRLYVYLISPEYLPKGSPPNGLRSYFYHKFITIYPDIKGN